MKAPHVDTKKKNNEQSFLGLQQSNLEMQLMPSVLKFIVSSAL